MPTDVASKIQVLSRWVSEAKHLVVFTGAGISTESGIADYRREPTPLDPAADFVIQESSNAVVEAVISPRQDTARQSTFQ